MVRRSRPRATSTPAAIVSNTFELEWPPRSGRMQSFPEVDRAGWFGLDEAREKLNPAQAAFVDRLEALLDRLSARGGSRTHTPSRTVGFKPTASDQLRHPGRDAQIVWDGSRGLGP